jgi:hypothetical protein
MGSATFYILPRQSRPFGRAFEQWTAKWWQWVLNIPAHKNPMLDQSGQNASLNQGSADVFFLCQTYEQTSSIPTRVIEIPIGKLIFMPVINWLSLSGSDGFSDEELLSIAKKRIDMVVNLEASINGERIHGLEKFRVRSPFFEVDLPEGNVIGLPPGNRRGVSEGYWIFIVSECKKVNLKSFGSCSSGATKIGVNYNISFV